MLKSYYLRPNRFENIFNYSLPAIVLIGLCLTSIKSYLLFHSLAEIFSIFIAFSVFVITWNSKKYIKNSYLLFVGLAYLSIGFLDLLHTLSYKGMPIFTDYDFYANQLWIGTRFLESISLLAAFYFLYTKKNINPYLIFSIFAVITSLLVLSIFVWKVFPECFVANQGLTPFKKYSEYVICIILGFNVYFLNKNKLKFEPDVFKLLLWAIYFTIFAELAFTFYVSNYGFSNLLGHCFKILSFSMIYLAIVKTGLKSPLDLIFRELSVANKELHDEIEIRKRTEMNLKKALEEIKTLRGIIPICSYCKKIRNDEGAWEIIEAYISTHSDAQFSHGACPDCLNKQLMKIENAELLN